MSASKPRAIISWFIKVPSHADPAISEDPTPNYNIHSAKGALTSRNMESNLSDQQKRRVKGIKTYLDSGFGLLLIGSLTSLRLM
jgi:hypothetical protein